MTYGKKDKRWKADHTHTAEKKKYVEHPIRNLQLFRELEKWKKAQGCDAV